MVKYVPKDLQVILDALDGENDRSVALVSSSLLEHILQEVIKTCLRDFDEKKDKADLEDLFGFHGIFSGLSGKILACYALKIIGPKTRRNLDLLSKIRNEFAHDMNPLLFEDQRIKDRCNQLALTDGPDSFASMPSRRKFLGCIHYYIGALYLRCVRGSYEFLKSPEIKSFVEMLEQ